MKRLGASLACAFAALLLGACLSQTPPATQPLDQDATATLSAYPAKPVTPTSNATPDPVLASTVTSTALPTAAEADFSPTPAATGTPLPTSWPFPLTIADNGGTFTYCVTCRFVVFLDPEKYPLDETVCTPEGIASYVSNATGLRDETTGYLSVGFEGVNPGECTLHNGDFSVTIKVID